METCISHEKGVNTSLDYLRFTNRQFTEPSQIIALMFPELVWEECAGGRNGYRKKMRCKGAPIEIWHDGTGDCFGTLCVEMPGQGMRLVEMLPSFQGWPAFLTAILNLEGVNVPRLDVAMDDLGGNIRMQTVRDHINDRKLVTRAQLGRAYKQVISADDRVDGGSRDTIYVGSRTSERMLRCYMKAIAAGDAFDGLRFEMEYKNETAMRVAMLIAAGDWDAVKGVMRDFIDFKEMESEGENKSRWKTATWWEDFVQAAKHKLNVARLVEQSIEKTWKHMVRQWSQFAYMLVDLSGGSLDSLYELAMAGKNLNKVNRIRLAAAKEMARFQSHMPAVAST